MPKYRVTRKYSCEQSVDLEAISLEEAKLIANKVVFSKMGEQPLKDWFDSEEVIEDPSPLDEEAEVIHRLEIAGLSEAENSEFFGKLAEHVFDGKPMPPERVN